MLRISYMPLEKLPEILDKYRELVKGLDQRFVYVAEAGINPDRIVQLRPFFKRNKHPRGCFNFLGIAPEEGIEFNFKDGKYPGLHVTSSSAGTFVLPDDVVRDEKINVYVWGTNHGHYMSHAGLRNIESPEIFHFEEKIFFDYRKIKGAKTIRYIQTPDSLHTGEFKVITR
jgi:hypothetical protein